LIKKFIDGGRAVVFIGASSDFERFGILSWGVDCKNYLNGRVICCVLLQEDSKGRRIYSNCAMSEYYL
jgi:hypothetical protein